MARKKDDKPKRDFDKFSWNTTLQRIYQSRESSRYLEGAFVGNAMKQGSNGKGLEALVAGAMADRKSKESAIAYTAQQYESEMEGVTVGEYLDNYDSVIDKYFDDEAPTFEKYKDMKLNDYNKEIMQLQHEAKNPDEEKAEEAEEKLEKYAPIMSTMRIIEDENFKKYLPQAIELTNKNLAKRIIREEKRRKAEEDSEDDE